MFDFEEAASRRRVEAILTSRMNERCLDELRGAARVSDRSSCISVICIIPQKPDTTWDFEQATPALSRDISQTGLSVLHNEQLDGEVLIEVPRNDRSDFVRCKVQHNHEMGRGYFHIGMSAKEEVHVEAMERNRLETRLAEFEADNIELT